MNRTRLLFTAVLVGLVVVGQVVRSESGVGLDADSLHAFVERQRWLAPVIFVLLVTIRQFVLVPSALLLGAGGMLFGPVLGSALGALGMFLSTLCTFGFARGFAGEAMRTSLAERYPRIAENTESSGPLIVFLTIAYPIGVMTPVILAAAFSSMRVGPVLLAGGLGGAVRATTFAVWGATLPEAGSSEFWAMTALVLAATLLPLAHPGFRRLLRGGADPAS